MSRVTLDQLAAQVDRLNELAGTPKATLAAGVWQIGNYHTSEAYGAIALHQVYDLSGTVRSISSYGTRRELRNLLDQLIAKAIKETTNVPFN